MSGELWLPVVGYEGLYIVSNLGRIQTIPRWVRTKGEVGRRMVRGMLRKTPIDHTSTGYRYVGLYKDGVARKHDVHVLVLAAFVGPRPDGMDACHNDGDRTNPALSNLRWDTKKANQADRLRHGTDGRGERSSRAILTAELVTWIRESGQSSLAVAAALEVGGSTVRAVRLGQNWSHTP
jgi:hypothetical protein